MWSPGSIPSSSRWCPSRFTRSSSSAKVTLLSPQTSAVRSGMASTVCSNRSPQLNGMALVEHVAERPFNRLRRFSDDVSGGGGEELGEGDGHRGGQPIDVRDEVAGRQEAHV